MFKNHRVEKGLEIIAYENSLKKKVKTMSTYLGEENNL